MEIQKYCISLINTKQKVGSCRLAAKAKEKENALLSLVSLKWTWEISFAGTSGNHSLSYPILSHPLPHHLYIIIIPCSERASPNSYHHKISISLFIYQYSSLPNNTVLVGLWELHTWLAEHAQVHELDIN